MCFEEQLSPFFLPALFRVCVKAVFEYQNENFVLCWFGGNSDRARAVIQPEIKLNEIKT